MGVASRLQWLLDGIFQQQRLAYETVGVGGWRDADTKVPTTDEDDFAGIDASDMSHPRLQHKNAGLGEEVTTSH
ncbi:hypothetical protein B0H67DRAFT_591615 [Lasiosphaeris hirsuta]|uniref:Uncharacterized protein n=1 Tax=Lasiosphaeris hirsuta TaxID=260670 RepID=A0AA39ZVX2_9PEZI|nr:hypothetical protein B0H67DRAFT_591615 [Lasiosphaeris hirsuta]